MRPFINRGPERELMVLPLIAGLENYNKVTTSLGRDRLNMRRPIYLPAQSLLTFKIKEKMEI